MLQELTHERFSELAEYVEREPIGWPATQLAVQRTCYHIRQAAAPHAKLKEKDFAFILMSNVDVSRLRDVQEEAWRIDQEIRAALMQPNET